MFHIKDGLLGLVSVFQNIVVFLLLTHLCGGWSQEVGPQVVMAMVGDDVVLPCPLEAPVDARSMTLEWGRPDLEPRFVHVWHDGQELLADQNEAYKGRTSLSISNLKGGDVSLKLSTVKPSDNGRYRCYNPKLGKEYFVELLVGAVSSPAVSLAGLHRASGGAVLRCESGGWYPEPELLWLDAEGNLLSAGAPESVRGPDDLYAVSGRATVEKRHGNSFTCRVHQKTSNRTRDAHITVPDDFFVAPCRSAAYITAILLACFMCVLVVAFFLWRWRRKKTKTMKATQSEQQQLMAENQKREVAEQLQKKEEEHGVMVGILREQEEELMKQRHELKEQQEKMEDLETETNMKLESVDKDETLNKAQECSKLKEIINLYKFGLRERETNLQHLVLQTDGLLEKIQSGINTDGQEAQDEE